MIIEKILEVNQLVHFKNPLSEQFTELSRQRNIFPTLYKMKEKDNHSHMIVKCQLNAVVAGCNLSLFLVCGGRDVYRAQTPDSRRWNDSSLWLEKVAKGKPFTIKTRNIMGISCFTI